jgi:hypothetical protein
MSIVANVFFMSASGMYSHFHCSWKANLRSDGGDGSPASRGTTETCAVTDVAEFNSFLIPAANTEVIEEAVLTLAVTRDLRERFGQAPQQSKSGYTWQRSASMLERLFPNVIASEGQASV